MERERKFLITKRPFGLGKHPHKLIRQGYLAIPRPRDDKPVEVRVREQGGQHILTVKGGHGRSREEVEVKISPKEFHKLWKLTQGRRLEKVRYQIPLEKLTIELDIYRGALRGLMTAEVEFDSETQLRKFEPPQWFGRDISEDRSFSNSELATKGMAPSIRKR